MEPTETPPPVCWLMSTTVAVLTLSLTGVVDVMRRTEPPVELSPNVT